MSARASTSTGLERARFEGVRQIVLFNWPQYVCGAMTIVLAAAGLCLIGTHEPWLRLAIFTAVLLSAWWWLASLIASYWIYDRSGLCRWVWVADVLPAVPAHWLNLHAGLDESSAGLRHMFPGSVGRICDFYDAAKMSEPSIRRARARQPLDWRVEQVSSSQLPFAEATFDTLFLFFAAHELRCATDREAFFEELRRVLVPGGRLLLAEHTRDLANFIAFGPGFLHFQSGAEWRRLADGAGFEVEKAGRITPFVKTLLLRRAS